MTGKGRNNTILNIPFPVSETHFGILRPNEESFIKDFFQSDDWKWEKVIYFLFTKCKLKQCILWHKTQWAKIYTVGPSTQVFHKYLDIFILLNFYHESKFAVGLSLGAFDFEKA